MMNTTMGRRTVLAGMLAAGLGCVTASAAAGAKNQVAYTTCLCMRYHELGGVPGDAWTFEVMLRDGRRRTLWLWFQGHSSYFMQARDEAVTKAGADPKVKTENFLSVRARDEFLRAHR